MRVKILTLLLLSCFVSTVRSEVLWYNTYLNGSEKSVYFNAGSDITKSFNFFNKHKVINDIVSLEICSGTLNEEVGTKAHVIDENINSFLIIGYAGDERLFLDFSNRNVSEIMDSISIKDIYLVINQKNKPNIIIKKSDIRKIYISTQRR